MGSIVIDKYDWKNESPYTRDYIAPRTTFFATFIYWVVDPIHEIFNNQIRNYLTISSNIVIKSLKINYIHYNVKNPLHDH